VSTTAGRARTDLLLVIALTLLTNVAYFVASNGDYFYPDSATYLGPARSLLHGWGFATSPGVSETFRTPGYPVALLPFLALTKSAAAIVVVQHLLNVLLVAAIYLLARRRLDRFVALAASVIFAFDTPTIHHANKVLTETLFTAGLFALFVLALRIVRAPRTGELALAALLGGTLVLVRPVAILYFALLALFFLAEKVPWRRVAIFCLLSLVLPLAWAARNAHQTGVFEIASVTGSNFLQYRAAGAIAIESQGDFNGNLAEVQRELAADADVEIEDAMNIPDAGELPMAVRNREYARIGRRIFLEHPRGAAMLTIRGLLVLLFNTDAQAMVVVSRLDQSTIRMTIQAWTAVVSIFALVGLFIVRRRDRPLALLLGLTIAYFLLISAGGEAEARFRVPVLPMMAIAAAAALRQLTAYDGRLAPFEEERSVGSGADGRSNDP